MRKHCDCGVCEDAMSNSMMLGDTSEGEKIFRGFAAIRNASVKALRMPELDTESALVFLRNLWAGWEAHRDFDEHTMAYKVDIVNPQAVAIFEHERGIRSRSDPRYGHESYVFTGLSEICSPRFIEKYERMLGTFAEIVPMWEDCPYHPQRVVVWSRSPNGAGNAMECRMEAKRILRQVCPALAPWMSKIRRAARQPKCRYLEQFYKGPPQDYKPWMRTVYRTPSQQPPEYRRATKADLWLRFDCPPNVKRLMTQVVISHDPRDFWQIAAGKVRSLEVEAMMVHQRRFLGFV